MTTTTKGFFSFSALTFGVFVANHIAKGDVEKLVVADWLRAIAVSLVVGAAIAGTSWVYGWWTRSS